MLTAAHLRQILEYDQVNGAFIWKSPIGPRSVIGGMAGSLTNAGYWRIKIAGKPYMAHRLAWLYIHGEFPASEIDHINGCRDDNRLENLRLASRSQNLWNSAKRKDNSSGFKGTKFDRRNGRWAAKLQKNGKYIHLGMFATAKEAHEAYGQAATRYFGEFARSA